MAAITANGMQLEFEDLGPPDGDVIVLIMGLGAQLIYWPDALCHGLADDGFRVIRYDNRDVGLSTKCEDAGMPDIASASAAAMRGQAVNASYTLFDMAEDAIGLLDGLNIGRAHIVGLSMGGMIAQIIAALHGDRTLSLTSIMSTTGRRGLPPPQSTAFDALLSPRPDGSNRDAAIAHLVNIAKHLVSPNFRPTEAEIIEKQTRIFDRSYYPVGLTRHFMAILASGSREEMLKRVTVPTLVLHGAADPLMAVEHGQDTALCVQNGRLEVIEGMGHDLPPALVPVIQSAIAQHCRQACQ